MLGIRGRWKSGAYASGEPFLQTLPATGSPDVPTYRGQNAGRGRGFPRDRGPRGTPTPPGGSGHPRVAVEGAWQWPLRYACCLPHAARLPTCPAWRPALRCLGRHVGSCLARRETGVVGRRTPSAAAVRPDMSYRDTAVPSSRSHQLPNRAPSPGRAT